MLLEEYYRLISKQAHYKEELMCNITDERRQKLKKFLENIMEDVNFIDIAFKGNGLDIQKELVQFIEQSRK